jgi:hypothetical protein
MKRSVSILGLVALASWAAPALAQEKGDDVEITSGSVTGLSCALEAQKTGRLELLAACPLEEARKEIVIFDVAERVIYRLAGKKVAMYELEGAYGGGAIDLEGTITQVDAKTGVATVTVEDYSVTKKPKAGGFKGCL